MMKVSKCLSKKHQSTAISHFPDAIIQMIFQHIPQLIFWKDIHSVYLGCNDRFAQLVGFESPQEIIGKTDHELGWLSDGDTAHTFQQGDQRTLQGQYVINEEELLSTRTGQRILTLINKVPIYNAQGKITGVLGVATDITEKKAAAEHLAKIQYQLEGMTIVSASIAHELRTPLAALKSAAQGIQQSLPSLIAGYQPTSSHALSEETLQLLSSVVNRLDKKVDEANQVIQTLLSNLRECRNGVFKTSSCSVKTCIHKAFVDYVLSVANKPTIVWDERCADFTFAGKEMLLVHVLGNLLKNAIYFVRKAGKGQIHVWLEHAATYNAIHVKDTGMGIPQKYLPHIFEPFFTHGVRKGTGIGLAFCAFTLQSFGASIRCKSVYHEYTEFILTFPKQFNNQDNLP